MHVFKQATYFVRDTLAHASDAQLRFCGLTNRERDRLLEKTVTFKPMTRNYEAAFYPWQSKARNVSYVSFNKSLKLKASLDAAAHEQFHAARFWGSPAEQFAYHMAPVFFGGIILNGVGGLLQEPVIETVGTGLILGAPLLGFGVHNLYNDHREEQAAYRFGNLFNEKVYSRKRRGKKIKPLDAFSNVVASIVKDYPKQKSIDHIYKQTKQECIGGNILFPGGSPKAAFKEWQKTNALLIQ